MAVEQLARAKNWTARKVAFIAKYFLTKHILTVMRFRFLGLRCIVPFRMKYWYTGEDSEKTIRKYFRAKMGEQTCFVKLAENDSTIDNEIFVNDYLNSHNIGCSPKLLLSSYDHFGASLLVTQFMANLHHFRSLNDASKMIRIIKDFDNILDTFAKHSITHNDINCTNLMLNGELRLVVTDFGIGHVPGCERFSIDYDAHDGTYYQTVGNERIYDDAYSFLCMLSDLGIAQEVKHTSEYKHIVNRVGMHTYKVNTNKK